MVQKILNDLIERVAREIEIDQVPSPASTIAYSDDFVVEIIVNKRVVNGKVQYLARWAGYNSDDDTWLTIEELDNCLSLVNDYEMRCMREFLDLEAQEGKPRACKRRK